jgi:hypothetical protein
MAVARLIFRCHGHLLLHPAKVNQTCGHGGNGWRRIAEMWSRKSR